MRSFGFRVIPSDPDDRSGVPVAVAGQVMVDVQKIITDIGTSDVRIALRLQNEIPEGIRKKFDLTIGGSGPSGMSSGPSEGNDEAMENALTTLCETLDFLGKGAVGNWMTDKFEDDESRCQIAQDLIALNDHLAGYTLEYGIGDDVKRFHNLDKEKILRYTYNSDWVSAAIGVVVKDSVKKNHWNFTNDQYLVALSFAKNIAASDIPSFAKAGPVIVMGEVRRNDEGHIVSIERVKGCYTLPEVKFYRIITSNGDRSLLNPLIAIPSYDEEKDAWSLRNDIIGMNVTKPSWDECIIAFHDYAQFLFESYVDSGKEFEGEEKEISEFLQSLLPVI
jgi:hypothetical protein